MIMLSIVDTFITESYWNEIYTQLNNKTEPIEVVEISKMSLNNGNFLKTLLDVGLGNPDNKIHTLKLATCTSKDINGLMEILRNSLMNIENNISGLLLTDLGFGDEGLLRVGEALVDPKNKIKRLDLGKNQIGPRKTEIISSVLMNPGNHIENLSLSSNEIGVDGTKAIGCALENENNKLQSLRLCSCEMNCQELEQISTSLAHPNSKLTHLSLGSNIIKDVKKLAEALANPNCKIDNLGLSFNIIEDDGVSHLTGALVNPNNHLVNLDIGGNRIGDAGLEKLAEALSDPNNKLIFLDAGYNSFFNISPLARALVSPHNKLETLDISSPGLEVDQAYALSDSLIHPNNKIKDLTIDADNDGIIKLAEALANPCNNIHYLTVFCNNLKEDGAKALGESLKKNKLKGLFISGDDSNAKNLISYIVHSQLLILRFGNDRFKPEIQKMFDLRKQIQVLSIFLSPYRLLTGSVLKNFPIELSRKLKNFLV